VVDTGGRLNKDDNVTCLWLQGCSELEIFDGERSCGIIVILKSSVVKLDLD